MVEIIDKILENKEWIFSGIGIVILPFFFKFIRKVFNNNSDFITVTKAGGGFRSHDNNIPLSINKNEIVSIENTPPGHIGNSVIVMRNGDRYHLTESTRKIKRLTKR